MTESENIDLDLWKRRRERTFYVFALQYFILAVELSINYSTSWTYMKETVGNDPNLPLYNGLLNAAAFLPTTFLSSFFGAIGDRTRKVKLLLYIGNFISMFGCVIYVIPGSVYYPIIGRLLLGFNVVMRPVMTGEIIRAYEQEVMTRKVTILRAAFVIGNATGPAIILIFLHVDFFIGSLHFRYSNMSSVILFTLLSVSVLLIFTFVYDLSSEFDMKMAYSETKTESTSCHALLDDINDKVVRNQRLTTTKLIKSALCFPDFYLVIICIILNSCFVVTIFIILPAQILDNLHYPNKDVNLVLVCQLAIFLLLCFISSQTKFNHVDNALIGWIGFIIAAILFMLSKPGQSYILNMSLLVISWSLLEIFTLFANVYTSVGLANLVSSPYQSFMDGLRTQASFVGSLIGSSIAVLSIKYPNTTCVIYIIISTIAFVVTLVRRNAFLHPSIKIA